MPLPRVEVLDISLLTASKGRSADVLKLMVSALPRWKTCAVPNALTRSMSGMGSSPDLLERVEVIGSIWHRLDSEIFNRAPCLYAWTGPFTELPWAQLSELNITEFTVVGHTFTHVLSVCPALVKLRLCLCRDPGWLEGQPRTLPRLEAANFTVGNPNIFAFMFSKLTTPRLKYLELKGVSKADPGSRPGNARRMLQLDSWPLSEFTDWLSRSQCTIDALSLFTIAMPRAHVVDILERLPSLQSFTIWEDFEADSAWAEVADEPVVYSSIDNGLLRRLTAVDTAAPSLLPQLKRLSIKGELRLSYSALLDMVKSRATPRLEYLSIYAGAESQPDDMDEDTKIQLRLAIGNEGIMEFDSSASISKGVDFKPIL
ncbi:uncharacterized protein SCHCODRAFT_02688254 [Schizophyllum commune H4-8]|nr:uncharacterized protein SCHCODRAFT_02688254 [Schizophyllum commune H4-8]KAI5894272.1 hypothetical protein SCHCODRAFT_02688254 [Schizophyllum commune H4-8]